MNGPEDDDDEDVEEPSPLEDSDDDLDLTAPYKETAALPAHSEASLEREYTRPIRKLVAELEDALAALAYEQVKGDALRLELGDDPLGPQRTYSRQELNQYLNHLKAIPFAGGGLTTRLGA